MPLNLERLENQLILHEGLRLLPYDDATGDPIKPGQHYRGKLTIGVGRNLDGNPLTNQEIATIGHNGREQAITKNQALMLLDHDVAATVGALNRNLPWWQFLDEVRARVLADLCFNMGIVKLLFFKNFLSHMRIGSFDAAADDLKDSVWYEQVGSRAVRLVVMVRTGKDWIA